MTPLLDVFVPGRPIARPSSRMWKRRKDLFEWTRTVQWTVRACMVGKALVDEPVELCAIFFTRFPCDLSNQIKSLEDAMNRTLWTDDKHVRKIRAALVKPGPSEREGVQITVYALGGEIRPLHSPQEARSPSPHTSG